MTLKTGDRSIRSVGPLFIDAGDPWPCSNCGAHFPRRDSWYVGYCHRDGDPYAFVVCRRCARELAPRPLVMDLRRLAGDHDSEHFALIESLLRLVAERRRDGDIDAVAIRRTDLEVLASAYGKSVPELVDWLRAEGLVQ